jgi:hypothetical protein
MKTTALLLSLSLFFGCNSSKVEPNGEVQATIIRLELNPTVYCTCCQGYRVQIGNKEYFTNRVPAPFDKPNSLVLIRYTQPESECGQSETPDRIQITSIRAR